MIKSIYKIGLIAILYFTVNGCSKNDNSDNDTYVPTLSAIAPNNGPKTTLVTITGTNFGTDLNTVKVFFNEKEAVVQSVTNTVIEAIVPVSAYTGVVKVMVNDTELIGPEFTYILTVLVDTFAGSDAGNIDGSLESAKFNYPTGLAFDSKDNLFVVDNTNHSIRKITPNGAVSTFAGGIQGFADATGTAAKFNYPYFIAIDTQDNLFVTDRANHKIRKITPNGVVTTFAGSTEGNDDGAGTDAKFSLPYGITIDSDNNLYVSDVDNHNIRKITSSGEVTTLAGSTQGFADANIGTDAKFNFPSCLAIDKDNNLIVADFNNHKIRKISLSGMVSTLVGGATAGHNDGPLADALLNKPIGISIDSNNDIYISSYSHTIRKISINKQQITTIAGNQEQGNNDGIGTDTSFNRPFGLTITENNTLYLTDTFNHRIRTIVQE